MGKNDSEQIVVCILRTETQQVGLLSCCPAVSCRPMCNTSSVQSC